MSYRKTAHSVYDIKYHVVWITKYRKQVLKGRTSRKLLSEFETLNRAFWGRHLWARGYFAASTGDVTDEIIKQYIESQGKQPPMDDDNFAVTEL